MRGPVRDAKRPPLPSEQRPAGPQATLRGGLAVSGVFTGSGVALGLGIPPYGPLRTLRSPQSRLERSIRAVTGRSVLVAAGRYPTALRERTVNLVDRQHPEPRDEGLWGLSDSVRRIAAPHRHLLDDWKRTYRKQRTRAWAPSMASPRIRRLTARPRAIRVDMKLVLLLDRTHLICINQVVDCFLTHGDWRGGCQYFSHWL